MGNHLKKKEKNSQNDSKGRNEKKDKKDGKVNIEKNDPSLIKDNPGAIVINADFSSDKIILQLLNKQTHSRDKDPIKEAMVHPNFKNGIIIACKSGKIKLYEDITQMHESNNNQKILFDVKEEILSMILLKKNDNNICISLSLKIMILSLNKSNELIKEYELKAEPYNSLLELENGNIIGAGSTIAYWIKDIKKYKKANNVNIDYKESTIINLIDFSENNRIIATQKDTHLIYYIIYDKNKIKLLKKIDGHSSIWYKGSAKKLSDYYMLMVGKFDLNVIDGINGAVCNRYVGIDKGSLLNLTESDTEDNIWIVTDYYGKFFEFYMQEGNDLIFLDKKELDEENEIKWANQLVRINEKCFVAVNYHGEILTFSATLNQNQTPEGN